MWVASAVTKQRKRDKCWCSDGLLLPTTFVQSGMMTLFTSRMGLLSSVKPLKTSSKIQAKGCHLGDFKSNPVNGNYPSRVHPSPTWHLSIFLPIITFYPASSKAPGHLEMQMSLVYLVRVPRIESVVTSFKSPILKSLLRPKAVP